MSRATSAAIRFSNPSPRAFENGMLFGSAQTVSGGRLAASAPQRPTASPTIVSRRIRPSPARRSQPEDIDRASWRRVFLDLLHRAHNAEGSVGIVRRQVRE